MKFKYSILMVVVISLFLVISGCKSNDIVEEESVGSEKATEIVQNEIEPITLNYADTGTTGSFLNDQSIYFANKVSELSGGKIEVDIFADALLGNPETMLTDMQSGGLHMGLFISALQTAVPKAGMFDLPFLINDRSDLVKLKDAGIFEEIYAQAEEVNLKILGIGENGFRHITNNVRPIVEPEDLNGLVIRVPSSKLRIKTFETMGASTVALSFSEVYSALETGVADGQENPFSQIGGAQLYNVQKYLSLSGHVYTPCFITMNLDLYNSLSDAQKDVLEKAMEQTTQHSWNIGKEYDEEQLKICTDNGMIVNEVNGDDFRAMLIPLWDEYAEEAGGTEFVDKVKMALGY